MKFPLHRLSSAYRQSLLALELEAAPNPVAILREKITDAKNEADCRLVASRLGAVSNLYAVQGILAVLDNETAGWKKIRISATLCYLEKRIRCRSFDSSLDKAAAGRWIPNIIRTAGDALLNIALNIDVQGNWLQARLEQSRIDDSVSGWKFWNHPTPRLAIALHRLVSGKGTHDLIDLNLGVYQSVFEKWTSTSELKSAFIAASDYHVQNLNPREHSLAEFERAPNDLFPAEIVAIKRVRDKLGLETPPIDHPLMQTPLANPPDQIEEPKNELIEEAFAKIRSVAPHLLE